MKNQLVFIFVVAFFLVPGITLAEAPHQVGGFVLNQNIKKFEDQVIMDTALPVRYAENFEEVEIKETKGFKSGLIAYGTCAQPGNIVRIKLKYADSSKAFYEKLLKRYKQHLGEPDEYRGDPFKILIAWKWSFVDHAGNHISMILQHNTMDGEEKMGNALKLTLTDEIGREARCYEKKHPKGTQARERRRMRKKGKASPDWDAFIPR